MVPAGCSRYARRHQLKVRPLGRSSHRNGARHTPAAAAAPPVAPSAGRSLPASSGSPRVLRRAALPAATMMLALQIRLCTALASTAALSTTTTATATAVRFHRSRGAVAAIGHRRGGVPDGRRGAGTVALVAAGRTPTPRAAALRSAMPRGAATDATSPPPSAEGEVEFERDGETGGRSGVVPMDDERYLMRAERKRRRKLARQARLHNLGRAKSVRRAGSSSEMVGLEALHPPRGLPGSGAPALSGLPDISKPFTVLGIETSCDDTAAAVVRSDGEVLGEAIAGQAEVHEEWGGVVPGLARDSHALKMDGVVEKALQQAGLDSVNEVDAVAVTVGPGLEICLRVGAEKAKALATQYGKPFVAVHHLEAHALLARKAFPPTQASSASAASATTGSTSLSAPAGVSAAAAAASAAPSAGAFAAAFTAAVSDVSIAKSRSTPPSSSFAAAAADDVPAARGAPADAGSSAAAGGSVSAAAAAASAAPSATAFAAAFTAAVSDVSRSAADESLSARTSPPPRSPAAASGVSAVPPSDTDGGVESDSEKAEDGEDTPALEFPFLGLLVSGGHCQLLLCKGVGQYTILGGTVDDALGEAYDKAARLLGLRVGGGGGPAVEALALKGDPTAVPLTVPMQSRKDLDFSFAGLKNSFRMAVTRAVEEQEEHDGQRRQEEKGEELEEGGGGINGEETRHDAEGKVDDETEASNGLEGREENLSPTASMERRGAALPESMRADLAASFQHTAIKHLEERVRRAMDTCDAMLTTSAGSADDARSTGEPPEGGGLQSPRGGSEETSGRDRATEGGEERKGVRALAVVGGVAANQELRRRLQALCDDRQPAPWKMVVPPARLCTDNGVMVAWAAIERLREGMSNDAESQEVYARLPLGRSAGQEDVGVGSL